MNEPSSEEVRVVEHLVVGDGITALAFVENCALKPGDALVVLGGQASELGRGVAYGKGDPGTAWRYAYLLNSPADDIDPAFARWLSDRWSTVEETMTGRAPNWMNAAKPLVAAGDIFGVNAPREFYGDFMREQAEATVDGLRRRGVQVAFVDDRATGLDVTADGVRVSTQIGQKIHARSVDVAPGGPSTLRIDGDDGRFSAPTVFGQEERIAEQIKAGAEIFCIGGNAAMLDVLRLCQSLIPDAQLRFVACAPDGEIPEPLIPRLPRKLTAPRFSAGHETAESFLAEVWREIELAKRAGDEMREIRAGFRAHFLAHPLTQYVADEQQARRIPAKLRFWLRGGTRDTILDMRRLVAADQVRVMPGLVTAIEHLSDGARVRIADAVGGETVHETGFVVNCAGAGPGSRYDPLTENMLSQGLIQICDISRGLKVGDNCRAGTPAIRYLSPATIVIGSEVMAMPLYDAHVLRTYASRASLPSVTKRVQP
ncbi:FAD/NAD(P)-binding protein [Actibacterium sp. 188UL27-1]|uniref:FAD/NAD(P)-binding protein n=1 Tax=Actibacterium sp. 188UL27-1 TaxID=2786961 RepID=UPI00195C8E0D|nr:FAD/NAD(P)-binding protein [Actibacterium sp. 188UL27-1]MBM7068576.1 FAD/NAD(P)-binding protein [Actibacterium sp. 188UL27-1]